MFPLESVCRSSNLIHITLRPSVYQEAILSLADMARVIIALIYQSLETEFEQPHSWGSCPATQHSHDSPSPASDLSNEPIPSKKPSG